MSSSRRLGARSLLLRLLVATLPVLALSSCADLPSSVTRPAQITLNFLTPATVRSVVVEVSGPGVSPSAVLNIPVGVDSVARGTLALTAGAGRRFVFSAYDSAGVATHRADTTLALVSGGNPALAVRLVPLVSTLGITVTFGGVRVVVSDTATRTVGLGQSVRIAAVANRADGTQLPADSLTWGSSNPGIATVNAGLVGAVRQGEALIFAQYRGAAASVRVIVSDEINPAIGDSSVIAWYPLDGTANDASGRNRHGTVLAADSTPDRFGRPARALQFDGVAGGFATPSGVLNLGAQEYSISLWFKVTEYLAWARIGNGEVDGLILTNPHNGIGVGFDYQVQGRASYAFGTGSSWLSVYGSGSKTAWDQNRWYHLVVRKSGTTFSVYVDGTLDYSITLTGVSSVNQLVQLNFGGGWSFPQNPGWGTMYGAMDDVRVYGRALTVTEIQQQSSVRP